MSEQKRFCDIFQATIETSHKQYRKIEPLPESWWQMEEYTIGHCVSYPEQKIKTIQGIAIHLPEDRLSDLIRSADDSSMYKEMTIRDNVPAVKKAWEHYQMLLKMCGGDY